MTQCHRSARPRTRTRTTHARHPRRDHAASRARREQADRRAPRQACGPARRRQRLSERLPSGCARRRTAGGVRRTRRGGGRIGRAPRAGRGPHDGQARDGQGQLRAAAGPQRRDPAVPAGRCAGRRLRGLQGLGRGRHPRGRGHADADPHRRAVGQVQRVAIAGQVPAAPAGQVARPRRHRDPLPPALRRPDHQPRFAPGVPPARGPGALDPRLPRGAAAGLHGGRDADDAPHPRGCRCASIRDPPQRAGPGHVPAGGAGAVPQAPGGGRLRARLRDQPELPQRGRQHPAQPRIHHAGAVPGLRHLRGDHGPDRGTGARRRAGGGRSAAVPLGGARHRPRAAVPPLAHGGGGAALQPGDRGRGAARPRGAGCALPTPGPGAARGRRLGQAAAGPVRAHGGGAAGAAHFHHRLPDRGFAAGAGQ